VPVAVGASVNGTSVETAQHRTKLLVNPSDVTKWHTRWICKSCGYHDRLGHSDIVFAADHCPRCGTDKWEDETLGASFGWGANFSKAKMRWVEPAKGRPGSYAFWKPWTWRWETVEPGSWELHEDAKCPDWFRGRVTEDPEIKP